MIEQGGEEKMSEQTVVYTLPVLPLKSAVLFPYLMMPSVGGTGARRSRRWRPRLRASRKKSWSLRNAIPIMDAPAPDDLTAIGTKAVIRKMNRSSEGHLELMVLGMERVALLKLDDSEPFLKGARDPAAVAGRQGP